MDVIVDGLIQAAVVALVAFVLTLIWTWLGHLNGVWLERAIGALFAFFAMAFILNTIAIFRETRIRRDRRKQSASNHRGFLDYKLEAETAINALPQVIGKLSRTMGHVTPRLQQAAERMASASSTRQQLAVSKSTAEALDRISRRFQRESRLFEEIATSLSEGLNGWSQWIEEKSGANKSSVLPGFTDTLQTLIHQLDRSVENNQNYIATISGTKGASRVLDPALDRHIAIIENICQGTVALRVACEIMLRRLNALPDVPLG